MQTDNPEGQRRVGGTLTLVEYVLSVTRTEHFFPWEHLDISGFLSILQFISLTWLREVRDFA